MDRLQEVEDCLKSLSQTLYNVGLIVQDFQPESDRVLQKRVNEIALGFKTLMQLKNGLDVKVPMEVLEFIEEGRNPDLFTKEFVERVAAENHYTNGKIWAFQEFHKVYWETLQAHFPEQTQLYSSLALNKK